MQKKKEKTELLQLLGHQCFFEYEEKDEKTIKGLREIAEYYFPEWLVSYNGTCMALVNAFLYGTIMGIRSERKKRKEKADKHAELPLATFRMMSDEEWNRLAYRNQMEQKGGAC